MLVLGRSEGQATRLIIPPSDQEQEVTVHLAQSTGKVRLGFEADDEVRVVREELLRLPAPDPTEADSAAA